MFVIGGYERGLTFCKKKLIFLIILVYQKLMSYLLNTFYVKESQGNVSKFIIELESGEFKIKFEFLKDSTIRSLIDAIENLTSTPLVDNYSVFVKNDATYLRKSYVGGHVDIIASEELVESLKEGLQRLTPPPVSPCQLSITFERDLTKDNQSRSLFIKFNVTHPKKYIYVLSFPKLTPEKHGFMCTQLRKMVLGQNSFYNFGKKDGASAGLFTYKIQLENGVVSILDSKKKGVTFEYNEEFKNVLVQLLDILETSDTPEEETTTATTPVQSAETA